MKYLIPIIVAALLISCRSQRQVQTDTTLRVDSVVHTAAHRTAVSLDSIASRLEMDFDTLDVTLERQVAGEPSQTVKIRATGGKISRCREQLKFAAEQHERLDTLAYKRSRTDKTAEHTATTRLYDPPDGTAWAIAALAGLALLAYIIFRWKI